MHRQNMLRWHPIACIIALALTGLISAPASAQSSPSNGRTAGHFQLEAVSEFPVQIGMGFQAEFQSRIQFRTTVGMVPAAYLGVANDILVGISDEYSRREAELIENVLERSLMWQIGRASCRERVYCEV